MKTWTALTLLASFLGVIESMAANLSLRKADASLGPEFDSGNPQWNQPGTVYSYKVGAKHFDPDRMDTYLARFGIPASVRPTSAAGIRKYQHDKTMLIFDERHSEYSYSTDAVPDLEAADSVREEEIQAKADRILFKLLGKDAIEYAFLNYEKTMLQRSDYEAPSPIAYYANYFRRMDGRIVLDDRFRVRICFEKGGGLREFSIRDPLISQRAAHSALPTRDLPGKVSRLASDLPDVPFQTGPIPVTLCQPLKRFASYFPVSKGDGDYLVPHISILTENLLDPFLVKATLPKNAPEYVINRLNIPEIE